MQLRSGRSVDASTSTKSTHPMTMRMRRNSRNYEEFDERKKYQSYQSRQRALEDSIYTSEAEIIANQKKYIYITIRHHLHAIEYQKKNKHSIYDIIDTCGQLFKFLNDSMPFIVEHNAMEERLAKAIINSGTNITREIYRIDKTRAQTEKVRYCCHYIGNVLDMIEHHVLRRF